MQRYNGATNGFDQAQAVVVDHNGDVIVTGRSKNGAPAFDYDYHTIKYASASGAVIWEQRYNGSGNGDDQAEAVAVDRANNVVVTGFSLSKFGNLDFYTAKYAAKNGALIWEQGYNGPTNNNDYATAIVVDGENNVVVTGYSHNGVNSGTGTGRNVDFYTAKYAEFDGTILWAKRFNHQADDDDRAYAVGIDNFNNVAVAGISFVGHTYDAQTVKYSVTNGATLWQQREDGPQHDVRANALAVDEGGNVIVTGYAEHFNGRDFFTTKYQALDGAMLWTQRSTSGEANSVAVDLNGNIVVTGDSLGDLYTAKYASTNGGLLWERRYNGSANGTDSGRSVRIDEHGNVVVNGVSFNGTNSDSYTVKYAEVDGSLIWEKRFNGSGNGRTSMSLV